jgi:hypothetical protein
LSNVIVPPLAGKAETKLPEELNVWIVFEPSLVTVPPNAFCVSPE